MFDHFYLHCQILGHPLLLPPPGSHTGALLRIGGLHGRWGLNHGTMAGCHHRHHHDYHHHDYHHQLLTTGGAVGFYSGNLKTLTADMKALKPTILPAVPRFQIDSS